jgi:hypothetical protein
MNTMRTLQGSTIAGGVAPLRPSASGRIPVAVILAWIFDVIPCGIRSDADDGRLGVVSQRGGQRLRFSVEN